MLRPTHRTRVRLASAKGQRQSATVSVPGPVPTTSEFQSAKLGKSESRDNKLGLLPNGGNELSTTTSLRPRSATRPKSASRVHLDTAVSQKMPRTLFRSATEIVAAVQQSRY
mmetsp:Transcript_60906/g.108156  ORF Transcript_60906/g.108156 Transcript_60906/m.108156 type:complete len:112 (+) Transcript_60906:3-338(+)